MLIDECGLLLNPLVRRTWAPVGRTPVVPGWGRHRRRVSVIGAVTVSPHARRVGFRFATVEDGYFTAALVVAFLRRLVGELRGPVVVVWVSVSWVQVVAALGFQVEVPPVTPR